MAKRYYNLEKETKEYLKACEARDIANQTNIKTLNDYVINRKNFGLDCNFLKDNPIVIDNSLVLWLDGSIPSSYPAGGNIWRDLIRQAPASIIGNINYTTANKGTIIFDGTTNYASIPNSSNLNFGTTSFSISFFSFRISLLFQGGSYLSKGNVTSTGWGSRDFSFFVYSSLGLFARIPFNPTGSVWQHHVIVVRQNQSPYITYYRNGAVLTTSASDIENPANLGSVNNSNDLWLCYSNAGGSNRFYGGPFPCFHLYNKELTPTEILQNYNALKGRFGL